ncbi:MAG: 6-pyruvoyl trahydropterin synthase family protein [Halobacteriota archaeon]
MYALAIKRDFIAQHYQIGGDREEENSNHSHRYKVELKLEGEELDCFGYLVDIVDLKAQLDVQVRYFADRTLNDLAEFAGLNPSVERFAFILCDKLSTRIITPAVRIITVKIWENDDAWASYSREKYCNE